MGEDEAGAAGVVGIYPDVASQVADNHAADGESEAGALDELVYFGETLEDAFAHSGGDAATGVGYSEEELAVLAVEVEGEADGTALGGELECVVQ